MTPVLLLDPKTDFIAKLHDELLNQIKSTSTLETIEFHPIDELHLSLTRTVVLQHHWIDEFVRSVDYKLKTVNKYYFFLYISTFIETIFITYVFLFVNILDSG